jgi:hypothetical protein
MRLHTLPMPDDADERAVMYGPIVLAGVPATKLVSSGSGVLPVKASEVDRWLRPVPGKPLTFRTTGIAQDVTFVPLYKIIDQQYTVYWTMSPSVFSRMTASSAAAH